MLGEDRLMNIIEGALSNSKSEQLEVIIYSVNVSLTRYSNSYIHQNVSFSDTSISIRAVEGKRWGIISTNDLSDGGIKTAVERAREVALSMEENPDFESLPSPAEYKKVDVYRDEAEKMTPQERGERVKEIISKVGKGGFKSAGSYRVETGEISVGNSLGVRCYHSFSKSNLIVVSISDTSEGYSEASALAPSGIDHVKVASKSAETCDRSQKPREIEPGEYDVFLTPVALSGLMSWMSFVIFSGRMVFEGRSCLSGKMGEKVMGDNITIIDDGLSDDGFAFPFDFEGVPRERLVLIDKGVAKSACYDTIYGKKMGIKSTGHALPKGEEIDAIPFHLQMPEGSVKQDEMLSMIDKGLYVSNFHYINGLIDPRNAVFTGTTRYGLFYIEGGKIKYPVKDLRFTESMLKAFSNVVAISKERELIPSPYFPIAGCIFPSVVIKNFKFTSKTEH
ncbi:MAG: TldD/PmbA family protein [bacterium]